MGRTKKVEGEQIVEAPDYDDAKHFITITRNEYDSLIHESELLRCLRYWGLESTDVYKVTMTHFYRPGDGPPAKENE